MNLPLLFMVQKSHSQPPGMVLKLVVNNGIFNTISAGEFTGFHSANGP